GEDTVLRIEGVLDAVTTPEIRPTIEALVAEKRRSILVDASSLRLIDSSGVGVIVSLFKRCKIYGGEGRDFRIERSTPYDFQVASIGPRLHTELSPGHS